MAVYLITNVLNNNTYVGHTSKTIEERFYRHKYHSKTGNTYLYKAMRKYGIDNFIIECLQEDGTLEDEKKWIKKLNPVYNMTEGGTGGDTSDSLNYIQSMKDYHNNKSNESYATYGHLGKKHSNESKQIQSEKRKEYWDNLDLNDRIERSQKIKGKNNGMYGKTPKNSIRIEFNGVKYKSLKEAVELTGHSAKFLKEHGTIL